MINILYYLLHVYWFCQYTLSFERCTSTNQGTTYAVVSECTESIHLVKLNKCLLVVGVLPITVVYILLKCHILSNIEILFNNNK